MQRIQHSVDNWEGLLWATGGVLVPTKCFWYLIDFHWSNFKWLYVTQQQHPGELSINGDLQNQVQIPCLDMSKVHQILGVCLVPDGNWAMEVNYLKSIVLDWKVKMVASQLSPADALFSLKMWYYVN